MVCAGRSELPSHMCHAQGCLAGLPLPSFPVLVAIKCPTDKAGPGSGKLYFPSWSTVRTWAFTTGGSVCDE